MNICEAEDGGKERFREALAEAAKDHRRLPGHIGATQRCWENIRRGLKRCEDSQSDRAKCIEYCRIGIKEGFVTFEIWQELLEGKHPDRIRAVFDTDNFFDLSKEQLDFWERHIQNHPFAVLFADEYLERIAEAKARVNERCAEKEGLERIQSETGYIRILAGTDSELSDSTAIRIELYEAEHHPERYFERIRLQYEEFFQRRNQATDH